jgi:hypothetical protein
MYHEELFCQTGCQNGSSSIERAVRGAEAKKKKTGSTSEVEPYQTGPKLPIAFHPSISP